jgi:tRNA dimethylallyltransferase
MRRVLHLLTGPTAVGKTEWALRWAERHGAEIVSCDSLLFYRGMDLGTAKPTVEERARVPHHLIDILDPAERMTVVAYARRARQAVDEIAARGNPVLVVGGSGFYLRSFLAPVTDERDVPTALRSEVEQALQRDGLAALLERLVKLNPDGLGALDPANPRRVARALERCLASGRTLAALAEAFAARPPPFPDWEIRLTRLDAAPVVLAARIEARTRQMLAAGLLAEVAALHARGLELNPSASGAIGYRECLAVLRGERPEAELAREIAADTRALVKKQRTWFRTQLPPHRVIPAAEATVESLFAESPGGGGRP